jgi:hypothetical protein
MQKVVDFLEKNVQWLVLGLGGLVFLLMVYIYVIRPPVTVQVAGQEVLPGQIDAITAEKPVRDFKQALASDAAKTIEWKEPMYAKAFTDRANLVEAPIVLTRLLPEPKPVVDVPREDTGNGGAGGGVTPSRKLNDLPAVAAATFKAINNGRSVVMLPDPKAKKQQRPGEAQPQQVNTIKADKDWVSVAFDVDATKLGEAVKKVYGDVENLPPNIYDTQIVNVELVREEKLPNGQWGNRTTVPPLSISDQPPFDPKDLQKSFE